MGQAMAFLLGFSRFRPSRQVGKNGPLWPVFTDKSGLYFPGGARHGSAIKWVNKNIEPGVW